MNASCNKDCSACPGRLVCHCLQVTEEMLLAALEAGGIETVKDIRRHTGAGGGCRACQRKLSGYLERRTALAMVQSSS
jgi:bacterioferritin-associated ferredoxin